MICDVHDRSAEKLALEKGALQWLGNPFNRHACVLCKAYDHLQLLRCMQLRNGLTHHLTCKSVACQQAACQDATLSKLLLRQ